MNLLPNRSRLCSYKSTICSRFQINFIQSFRRTISTSQWKKYLSILKINSSSTPRDVKDSFLKLSKIYHPDNKLTGSHAKFVELKEAYDALKDGHPSSVSSTPGSPYARNPYDNDLSHKSHVKYRGAYQSYTESSYQSRWGTGSQTSPPPGGDPRQHAWQNHARERQYRRQQADWEAFGQRRPFSSSANLTIFLGAIAWIVIYSSVLLIWDYNDAVKRGLSKYKARNYDDYIAYEEYLKRKEQRQLFKMKDQQNGETISDNASYRKYSPPPKEAPIVETLTTDGTTISTTLDDTPSESDQKPSQSVEVLSL